jgi:hypothetical protein
MYRGFQSNTIRRFRNQAWPRTQRFPDYPLPYGLRQEEALRRGLRGDRRLLVHHNPEMDAIYKLDAVVRHRDDPMLPAVGIQFTTKHDPDKQALTIAAVRRTRFVTRLIYLEAECPLEGAAFERVRELVRDVAQNKESRGIVCAILYVNEEGRFDFRRKTYISFKATGSASSQGKKSSDKQ